MRHRLPWPIVIAGGAGLLAVLVAWGEVHNWGVFLRFLYQVPYGASDPLYDKDIGFYLFSLPAYVVIKNWMLLTLFLSALFAGAIYWVHGDIEYDAQRRSMSPTAIAHGSVLLGFFFAVKAWSYGLDRYLLLYGDNGVVVGASYTDIHVELPVLWLLIGLSIVAAFAAWANLRVRTYRLPAAAAVLVFGGSFVLSGVVPGLFQRVFVKPNELQLEKPYIERNIALTQQAYNLRQITAKPFPAEQDLTFKTLEANKATIDNIRLWDWQPLMDTYVQLQEIRTYYKFHDVDVDRYWLDGAYQSVMLSARELKSSLLPPNAQTWVNRHVLFTHGNGVVMSPVTRKSAEGLPLFYLRDIPPVATGGPEIREPRIYYGEETDSYVIVKGSTPEFDYPKGKDNIYAAYDGTGGIPVGGIARKILFAWYFNDVNLLLSSYITGDSRIMIRRNIQERVRTIAPFLRLDHDPYLVISDGRLFWMQDAYTTSDYFPYAQPAQGLDLNYIRNSVKVVVDAYNGTVDFYLMDSADPIAATYQRIFPGLFKPFAAMPRGLAEAHSLSGGPLPDSGADLPSLPHGGGRRFLQPRGSLAIPAPAGRRRHRHDGALLHHHAAARGDAGRVLPHAPDGAEPPRQHDRVARRALRPARLRQADRLRVSQGEARLRAVPDRGADQSEHRNLPATLAVEPDGLAGDPRQLACDPDRELDSLCIAALFAGGAGTIAGAQARDRSLWRSCGDEGDARRGIVGALRKPAPRRRPRVLQRERRSQAPRQIGRARRSTTTIKQSSA